MLDLSQPSLAIPASREDCNIRRIISRLGLLYSTAPKQGIERQVANRPSQSSAFPCPTEAGHGILGQELEEHRLRRRLRLHSRRAVLFSRQEIQERSKALQAMQGQARQWGGPCSPGDANRVFGMRAAHHGALQTHPGQTRALPILLQASARKATACRGASQISGSYFRAELNNTSPLNPDGKPAVRTSVASCAQWRWL